MRWEVPCRILLMAIKWLCDNKHQEHFSRRNFGAHISSSWVIVKTLDTIPFFNKLVRESNRLCNTVHGDVNVVIACFMKAHILFASFVYTYLHAMSLSAILVQYMYQIITDNAYALYAQAFSVQQHPFYTHSFVESSLVNWYKYQSAGPLIKCNNQTIPLKIAASFRPITENHGLVLIGAIWLVVGWLVDQYYINNVLHGLCMWVVIVNVPYGNVNSLILAAWVPL